MYNKNAYFTQMLRSFVRTARGVSPFISSRASLSFGQIRKKDANGNIIEPEVNTDAQETSAFSKEEKLTPEQVQAIQKAVRAQIENQLHDAFKERISRLSMGFHFRILRRLDVIVFFGKDWAY